MLTVSAFSTQTAKHDAVGKTTCRNENKIRQPAQCMSFYHDSESKKDCFYASHKCKKYFADTHWHDFYEILVITEGTMTEHISICEECGIPSLAHFLKDFKIFYGVTPSQYRKLNLRDNNSV